MLHWLGATRARLQQGKRSVEVGRAAHALVQHMADNAFNQRERAQHHSLQCMRASWQELTRATQTMRTLIDKRGSLNEVRRPIGEMAPAGRLRACTPRLRRG